MNERIPVLGVGVNPVSEEDVLRWIAERVASREPGHVATVNVEYVMMARRCPDFARVLRHADLATPDSAGILWALRRRGIHVPRRVGGSDMIWSICEQAAQMGHRIFFLGGAEGVAAAAAERLAERYPGLHVAGTYAGSPSLEEEDAIATLIREARADIVLVAYGAPEQDLWIARTLRRTGVAVAMGVGGSMDYVAGTARRAPVWMRERGLEWLWRLIRQPWRWRRMLALPHFVCLVWANDWQKGIR